MLSLLLLLAQPVFASSLDNLEVGGLFGTPNSDDPTALWWNPAGLATGEGTRFHFEGAPTFANMNFDRSDEFNGGLDKYQLFAVVPYGGLATDFGVKNLGFG